TITQNVASTDAMTVTAGTNATVGAVVAGVTGVTRGDPTPLTLNSGDFTLQAGSGAAVGIEGTFKDAAGLAAAINAKGISGVSAFADQDGKLHLASQEALTEGGTKGGTGAGNLGFNTTVYDIAGDLASSNVKTVVGANDT